MANPKYMEWLQTDKLVLLQGWARDGLSNEQLAHNMGITPKTLYNWMKREECLPILQAIKNGKEVVDYIVENALMKQAVAGNVTAQIFWLKNRKPDKWNKPYKEPVSEAVYTAEEVIVKMKDVANAEVKEENSNDASEV